MDGYFRLINSKQLSFPKILPAVVDMLAIRTKKARKRWLAGKTTQQQ